MTYRTYLAWRSARLARKPFNFFGIPFDFVFEGAIQC